jgi:hypothetical protein
MKSAHQSLNASLVPNTSTSPHHAPAAGLSSNSSANLPNTPDPQTTSIPDQAPSTVPHPNFANLTPVYLVNPPMPTTPPSVTRVAAIKHADFAHHFWYSYSVHEMLNAQLGLPEFHTFGATALADSGIPPSELQEFHSCRHSFPHVPQRLLPHTRPDGLPGQYLHLTQIPQGIDVDSQTSLSHSY